MILGFSPDIYREPILDLGSGRSAFKI